MKSLSNLGQSIQPSLTLQLTARAKALKAEGKNVISFGAGEPDFNTPEHICNAAKKAIDDGQTKYTPASGIMPLKEAICEKYETEFKLHYQPENIVVSNGAKHSLYNALFAICNPGDEILLPSPYWVSYPEMIRLVGAKPVLLKTDEKTEFKVTQEMLDRVDPSRVKGIILNNPSNPTGALYTKEELQIIAKWCVKHDVFMIADEIYEKLVYDGETFVPIASLGEETDALTITINGMSKAYAMTGWRIGYLIAKNTAITKIINSFQSHVASNPNSIAQYASVTALQESKAFIQHMRTTFEKRRNLMLQCIQETPYVSAIVPKGAFYVMMNVEQLIGRTIKGKEMKTTLDIADLFLDELNVSMVPGIGFGIDTHMRLSYSVSEEDIKEGLGRVKKFLEEMA